MIVKYRRRQGDPLLSITIESREDMAAERILFENQRLRKQYELAITASGVRLLLTSQEPRQEREGASGG